MSYKRISLRFNMEDADERRAWELLHNGDIAVINTEIIKRINDAERYMDEEHFKNFMNSVHLRQLYDTGVDAEYGDHLITLSTCEYTYTNGRFVVVAKKV